MTMQDPIADMLARIKNAQLVSKKDVRIPFAKLKQGIAEVLLQEGYIEDYKVLSDEDEKPILVITLKYYEGKPVIAYLERGSRPGLRVYRGKNELPTVNNGLGITIVSTSKGVMSDRAARRIGEGGEIICYVS